ncbi:hypothetical protein F7725_011154 [Dissostichus mawsoni]|uniref:Uncharacterized protein n=1 Tax=Dissostichus mawsoni TaxID=36200 RepID=A0A7J5Z8R8_DISMA|nr:hypothetical protein F7725_011154 [Dissostichus mawsoni]
MLSVTAGHAFYSGQLSARSGSRQHILRSMDVFREGGEKVCTGGPPGQQSLGVDGEEVVEIRSSPSPGRSELLALVVICHRLAVAAGALHPPVQRALSVSSGGDEGGSVAALQAAGHGVGLSGSHRSRCLSPAGPTLTRHHTAAPAEQRPPSLQDVPQLTPSVAVRLQLVTQQVAEGNVTQAEPLLHPLTLQRFT